MSVCLTIRQTIVKMTLFTADSIGRCLEGIVCSGHRAVGYSCGFSHSSCRLWYVHSVYKCAADANVSQSCVALLSWVVTFLFVHQKE